jgi:hypothetical protein
MDGGSGLNILYVETLDRMRIPRTELRPNTTPFDGAVLGKKALPRRQITLLVTFGELGNFRVEKLTFEVVEFGGKYHTILGRTVYVKFMAIPNYAYLKLKMSGLLGNTYRKQKNSYA